MKTAAIQNDIQEIKKMVKEICNTLGIGATPPAKVIELREKARQRAQTLKEKVNISHLNSKP